MNVEILARLQFALTIMFHYIYPTLSIGLGLFLVIAEGLYLKTENSTYLKMAKFWTKVFAITFAIGVATGIVMEFEFGTNWAAYSRFVGDVFGSALAAEGIFAFFLESGFLALLLFGWDRIGKKLHYFSTVMVCLGAHFSAVWIIVANSWMQTPAGFHIVQSPMGPRAEITNFWEMVFNPSSMTRLAHSIVGCWLAGAFLVLSISAWYLLKKKHEDFAKKSMAIAFWIALISIFLQGILGHISGQIVARYQPAKLAAMEGLFHTKKAVPLTLFGIVDTKNSSVNYKIEIPKLLSFLSFNDWNAEIKGLDQVPRSDWPNVSAVFQVYHLMIATWGIMLALTLWSFYLWRKKMLETSRLTLYLLVFSVVVPQIGNQAGWIAAEMGRYPWIVQGYLRISDGLSKLVTAQQVLASIIMFMIVYSFLFAVFIYLLHDKIQKGPYWEDKELTPYKHMQEILEEK